MRLSKKRVIKYLKRQANYIKHNVSCGIDSAIRYKAFIDCISELE